MGKRDRTKPTVRRLDTRPKVIDALGIPTGPPDDAEEPEGLDPEQRMLWMFSRIAHTDSPHAGVPRSGVRRAYRLEDPSRPELLAEFAGILILHRKGRQLMERQPNEFEPLRWSERGDLRWFYFGEIVREDVGALAIGSLALHPWPNAPGAGFRGITQELLRAISPSAIVQAVASMPVIRRATELDDAGNLERIAVRVEPLVVGTPRRGRRPKSSDDQLRAYSQRYAELLEAGIGWGIHNHLGAAFGITPTQSAEWARRARQRGFLTKPGKGKAGGIAGPTNPSTTPKEK